MVHVVKALSYIVKDAEVDVFLEFSWFFCGPVDVDSFISGSNGFSNIYFVHLEFHSSHTVEAWLGEF